VSRMKLLLDVIEDMRSLADSLQAVATALCQSDPEDAAAPAPAPAPAAPADYGIPPAGDQFAELADDDGDLPFYAAQAPPERSLGKVQ